ncbi:MAG TPA: bifunctional phosphopantothenoylcysteine decarboxylase/phosphopantothenate--cysteine ligase CoaBC, partial [Actinomycetes bacterium]|nr:bifunctional phosphopantothenoylcysteine decarboxylase/phosphopantothenate--cysteine ligase CoaBC [Actinomycetes bacterium]
LTERGHTVRVIPTASALRFVGAATWAALSGQPVSTEVWDDVHDVPHVRLGREADLVVVAPATADLLAKAAGGHADDLLTSTLLTARCPVVYAPAMHTEMWQHQATQANVATLRSRGALVVEPAVGRLTGADSGPGRLPEPDELAELVRRVLARGAVELPLDLTGRHVVVSAGGTREHLDPVRFLGNRSSGRQGYALAATAVARGAEVTLVSANVALPDPAGAKVTRVVSTDDLRAAMLAVAGDADAIVMAAAPADFRPRSTRTTKIKKTGAAPEPIELDVTPDVLVELSSHRSRPGQVVVGFAAETGDETSDALTYARAKLARKGCDLLVVNEVREGQAFESTRNTAVVLGADGSRVDIPDGPKEALADVVWDLVIERLPVGNGSD